MNDFGTTIQVKLGNGNVVEAGTEPWLIKTFPSGLRRCTAWIDGVAYRCEKRGNRSGVYSVKGRAI